jgi:hypothetical protein
LFVRFFRESWLGVGRGEESGLAGGFLFDEFGVGGI